jgi:hypothetical protein
MMGGAIPRHAVRADPGSRRAGKGFPHEIGDIVTISAKQRGAGFCEAGEARPLSLW